ncbi:MAG: flagellar export chaperone FlgN [Planctomycetales bacterium]|nr:flagellar export chaperone FlgN [Planctomycetales bacterium]MCA9169670.1 flagellar export chaperone FlgN [Planctomycetales bacterium]
MTASHAATLVQIAEETCGYLANERSILESIIDHASRVKAALVARDLEQLNDLLNALQADQTRRSQLASIRTRLQVCTSELLGIPVADTTLSRLIDAVPESLRQRLETERSELTARVVKVTTINRHNIFLAARFSHLTQQLIEALTGRVSSPSYGKSGQLNDSAVTPLFESRA